MPGDVCRATPANGSSRPMFETILTIIAVTGILGIALLMFAENVFPPIPSEIIMPMAGFAAARGDLNFVAVVLAGSFGALLGALLWYGVGHWFGAIRLRRWAASHGRWLTMTPEDIDRATGFFAQRGGPAVLLGRLLPGIRTYISIPAGMARMRLVTFTLWTSVGTVIWTWFLAYVGFRLQEHSAALSDWLDPITTGILTLGLAIYLYRVVTFRSVPASGPLT